MNTRKHDKLKYQDAVKLVHSLKLKSKTEWIEWIKNNRDENLPVEPRGYYLNEGWVSWGEWLGTDTISDNQIHKNFYSYEQAKEYLSSFSFKNEQEFYSWTKTSERPNFIPASPRNTYANKLISMGDFLGNGNVHSKDFVSFEECRKYAQNLCFLNDKEWKEWAKTSQRPDNIPHNPPQVYKEWTNYPDFLGYRGKSSYGEKVIEQFLKQNQIDHKAQYSFDDCKDKGKLRLDFAIFKENNLVALIEYNGIQHYKEVSFFQSSTNEQRDNIKKVYCDQNNIPCLKIHYSQIKICEKILKFFLQPIFGKILSEDYVRKIEYSNKLLDFNSLKTFVHALDLKNSIEWQAWFKNNHPSNCPCNPEIIYKNNGWISWADFLGTNNLNCKTKKEIFLSYDDCKKWFKENDIKNGEEWRVKRKIKPDFIPSHPDKIYKNYGWIGWKEFLS